MGFITQRLHCQGLYGSNQAAQACACRKSKSLNLIKVSQGTQWRQSTHEAVSCHAGMLEFPQVVNYPVTLTHTHARTNTIRQLSRKENWAHGADNVWFMLLIIKGKQCLFILTPRAPTGKPEHHRRVCARNSGKDLWSLIMFLGGKAMLHL